MRTLLITSLMFCLVVTRIQAATFLFVSEKDDQTIATFKLDRQTGDLERVSEIKIDGEPGGLTTSPDQTRLYASIRSEGQLASFNIDPQTGSLTWINTVDAAADPAHVATDRTGRWLLSAYYVAGKAAIHRLHPDGSIDSTGRWYTTDEKAHAVGIDEQNRWVFVPHTKPNAIFQFELDDREGSLAPNQVTKVETKPNTGPRHFDFHSSGKFAYCNNEQGSSVTRFSFDPETGQLKELETLSTLPSNFSEPNSCARMEIAPNGKVLYSANRGHHSIAAFALDPRDGSMKRIGIYPTEKTPRSFSVDPHGNFLVAAGQDSDTLVIYRVQQDGSLDAIKRVPVGKTPWWVHFCDTDEKS